MSCNPFVTFLTRWTAATSWNHLSETPDLLTSNYSCGFWLFTSKYTFNNSLHREHKKKVFSSAAFMSLWVWTAAWIPSVALQPLSVLLFLIEERCPSVFSSFSLDDVEQMLASEATYCPSKQIFKKKKLFFFNPFSHSLQQQSQVHQT